MSAAWHQTGYQHFSLALPDGRIVGAVRGLYRTWTATVNGRSTEYLTESQAKAAVEREVQP